MLRSSVSLFLVLLLLLTCFAEASTADGFFVDDSDPYRKILYINHTNVSYAGMYYCRCSQNTAGGNTEEAASNIVVLDSEPQFSGTDNLADGDPVELRCGISYKGKANSSVVISNMAKNVIANCQQTASSECTFYGTSVADVDKVYICVVSLSNSSSGSVMYTKTISTTVNFSVRNVSIVPQNVSHCQNNGYCLRNITLRCNAKGNPDPSINWSIYINGQIFFSNGYEYTTASDGEQIIQCTASNFVGKRMRYSSMNFTTNVIDELYLPPTSRSENKSVKLGIGLGVGLGLFLIIVAVILIVIFFKRKKEQKTEETETYTSLDMATSSAQQRDIYTELNPQNQDAVGSSGV